MDQTRVILVEMPRILREIVREVVAAQPDIAVLDDGDEALKTIRTGAACVAITHLDDPAPASLTRLLGTRPQVRVIALSADGRHGTCSPRRCPGPGSP